MVECDAHEAPNPNDRLDYVRKCGIDIGRAVTPAFLLWVLERDGKQFSQADMARQIQPHHPVLRGQRRADGGKYLYRGSALRERYLLPAETTIFHRLYELLHTAAANPSRDQQISDIQAELVVTLYTLLYLTTQPIRFAYQR